METDHSTTATAPGGACVPARDDATAPAPRVGIAPDSWGVWNPQDPVQPEPQQYLREIAEAGYHFTELGPFGYLGTDASALRENLARHDLSLTGGTVFTALHHGPAALEEAWSATRPVAELLRELGAKDLIVIPEQWERDESGAVVSARHFDAQQWQAMCAGHDELGRLLLEEYGIRQQFHSHADSPVGTADQVTRLTEGTNPSYLNLCLDTGHFAYYHGNCLDLVRRFRDRIGYLHLKQIEPSVRDEVLEQDIDFATAVQRGVMAEPPRGEPALAPVLAEAARTTPDIFAIVEQDMYPLSDVSIPAPIARRTRNHLATCGTPLRFR